MVNVSKQIHSAEPPAAVHAAGDAQLSLAADNLSSALLSSPATPNLAGARGESPRDNPSLAVDYECESDEMADSGRLEQSPDPRRAADYEPSNEGA